ncbi:hypothetical protein AB0L00_03535, partial [Actinoallomurus sp. NPDC052308]|uniref:hypothetical protein n=1 Tax=Actinoallomurus sp. NPDC052308 TaxID=3155530 RepID=UPI00342070D0
MAAAAVAVAVAQPAEAAGNAPTKEATSIVDLTGVSQEALASLGRSALALAVARHLDSAGA